MNDLGKRKIIRGLVFGVLLGIMAFEVLYSNAERRGWKELRFEIALSVMLGVVGGLVFGNIYGRFIFLGMGHGKDKPVFEGEEPIVLETAANRLVEGEYVEGRMVLRRDSIVFKPYLMDLGAFEMKIEKEKLVGIEEFNSLWVLKNGLLLKGAEGMREVFILEEREEWKRVIGEVFDVR